MRSRPDRTPRGFSLVELVIVLVVIGLLGAIAIPRLAGATSRAVDAQIYASQTHFQRAIEMYIAEHGNRCPATDPDGAINTTMITFAKRLVQTTDDVGNLSGLYGPYLKTIPPNYANRKATVRIDGAAAGANTHGWRYDTGKRLIEPDDAVRVAGKVQ